MKQIFLKRITIHILMSVCLPIVASAAQFELVTAKNKVTIYYQKGEYKLDSITAHLLASDIELVSGYQPKVLTDISNAKGNIIIIGRAESALVKNVGNKAFDPAIKGKWESYSLRFLSKPVNRQQKVDICD